MTIRDELKKKIIMKRWNIYCSGKILFVGLSVAFLSCLCIRFLTAKTLIYAIRAVITEAAGTRLALKWILVKGFKLYSRSTICV